MGGGWGEGGDREMLGTENNTSVRMAWKNYGNAGIVRASCFYADSVRIIHNGNLDKTRIAPAILSCLRCGIERPIGNTKSSRTEITSISYIPAIL